MNRQKTIVVINDIHVPNHDRKTVNAVFSCMKDIQPDEVILNGDIADFEAISRFEKGPEIEAKFGYELEELAEFFGYLRKTVPKAKIYYVNGNHEERLDKYLAKNARELAWLPSLKIENILELKRYKIQFIKDRWLIRDGVMYSHLDKASANPGASSKAIGLKHTTDVVHGHVHKVAMMKHNNYTFIDNGCLCEVQQGYVKEPSQFKQAFTVIRRYRYGDKMRNDYQLIPIENHQFWYGSKLYKG